MAECSEIQILLTWDESVSREDVERFIVRLQEEVTKAGGKLELATITNEEKR